MVIFSKQNKSKHEVMIHYPKRIKTKYLVKIYQTKQNKTKQPLPTHFTGPLVLWS